jgi:hypothetical protein
VIVHGPTAKVVTVGPATVHTDDVSELNNSGSPGGDTDAARATGAPTVTSGCWAKVIIGGVGIVVSTMLTEATSEAFCTFADGLVSWETPPAKLAGPLTTAARRQIARNLHNQGRRPGKTHRNLSA